MLGETSLHAPMRSIETVFDPQSYFSPASARLDPDLWRRRRREMREIHKRIRFTAGFCKYSQLLALQRFTAGFCKLQSITRCFYFQHCDASQGVLITSYLSTTTQGNSCEMHMHCKCINFVFFFITTWSSKECPRSKAHSAAGYWPVLIKLELNQNLSNILGVPEVIS